MVTRELPILFIPDLARAARDGIKTQTMRVVRPQPDLLGRPATWLKNGWLVKETISGQVAPVYTRHTGSPIRCPHGVPGDTLWVRETWGLWDNALDEQATRPWRDYRRVDSRTGAESLVDYVEVVYRADWGDATMKWRPSIFLPRCLARTLLTVTDVALVKVQDINEAGAIAEGVDPTGATALEQFSALWDGINAKRGFPWCDNPWVWAVKFKRIH